MGKASIPWRLKALVTDIKTIAASFSFIRFRHVFREANFVADKLASFNLRDRDVAVWHNCLPISVSQAFQLDQLCGGVARGFSL
ncbi:hypothetical protein RchiOBHm_Chr4g0440421 [Rosa chinensis]|uniref:RNase H type-1 domain-containing protein n=1 Tax=Rosa chinensis TaxID=74649 RepID=A0A2P6R348_ROSCH|nr:hypothetical protein RchiOBHm_Chr4g0440421 [Rosa chinensis]